MTLDRTSYQGETIGVELPVTVDLTVIETEPGFAGDTQTGARKPATTETGLVVTRSRSSSTRATRSGSTRGPASTRLGSDRLGPMTEREPPDWALPAWDSTDAAPSRDRPAATDEAAARPGERIVPGGTFGLTILGVSDVTRAVREAVRGDERLRDVWVEGEVGRVTVSSAGHAYFTLKDERSQLQCVWFRDDRLASPFEPRTGLRVVAHGRVDVFDANGVYQLYVSAVQPAGFGDLALRLRGAQGAARAPRACSTRARKRPLPERPAVDRRRHERDGRGLARHPDRPRPALAARPGRRSSPCQVQGDGAPASIVAGARPARPLRRAPGRAAGREDAPDGHDPRPRRRLARGPLVVQRRDGRPGVVRHPVPVVCGVGHEVDVTLADFAADVRAPTPSAAAELVVPDRVELGGDRRGRDAPARGGRRADARRGWARGRRRAARARPASSPRRPARRVARAGRPAPRPGDPGDPDPARRRRPARPSGRAAASDRRRPGAAGRPAARSDAAGAASPRSDRQATLERGYAIVRRTRDGRIVRDPAEAPAGERLAIRVARGDVAATVDRDRGRRLMGDVAIMALIVVVAGGAGIALGMLLAPRIGRLVERGDDAAAGEAADDRER